MADATVHEGRCGALEWAVCATPYPGQPRSGDAFLVTETEGGGVLIGVVDGLGHGEEAATVAERALESLRQTAGRSLIACLTACHLALRGSRGAAMTLVTLDPDGERLMCVAVGNVDAAVVRPGHCGAPSRWSVPMRGGVVGDRLPPLRESSVHVAVGYTLIAATDGVTPDFVDVANLSLGTPDLARRLHTVCARTNDDALVLVARPWQAE